jgi:6-pyruvoyltetrahydropterin/6-carboxytetrahydropterin synthase
MYEVGVVSHFEAAHSLKGDFGPATRTHGHTYRVEIAVRGESLSEDGTLCDIGQLQAMLQEVIHPLNFQNLDELAEFCRRNSTAEVVAEHIFEGLASSLSQQNLRSLSVTVWESPQAFARVERDL